MKNTIFLFIGLLALTEIINAHVILEYPVGEESFEAGQTINIKWNISIPHDLENWDIYFSDDGGTNWKVVAADLPGSQFEYEWLVPDNITDSGQIRIYMDNAAEDYDDVSGNFMIKSIAVSAVEYYYQTGVPDFLSYPVPSGSINYYNINQSESGLVTVELYSLTGIRQMTIINEILVPGNYTGSWDASGLSNGIYLLRFQICNYSGTQLLILKK